MTSFRGHRLQAGRTVVQLGYALIAAGALVDTAYHVWWNGDDRHAGLGLFGHLVTLVGMVVTMAGVAAAGIRSSARQSAKGESDAARRGTSTA